MAESRGRHLPTKAELSEPHPLLTTWPLPDTLGLQYHFLCNSPNCFIYAEMTENMLNELLLFFLTK